LSGAVQPQLQEERARPARRRLMTFPGHIYSAH